MSTTNAIAAKSYIPRISQLDITNFKGIKKLRINNFAKVNLFIGKNSSGKSTIMEALYYTGREVFEGKLNECVERRSNRSSFSARELFTNYDLNNAIDVRIGFENGYSTGMNLTYDESTGRIQEKLLSKSTNTSAEIGNREYYLSPFSVFTTTKITPLGTEHELENRRFFDRSIFLDPTVKNDVIRLESIFLNKLKLSETDSNDLAKQASNVYDIKPSWEFVPHPDLQPMDPSRFTIIEENRRVFLDNFGDGLHYGIAILAAAKTRNNTALFVEEIESHQHPEALKKLISTLVTIAHKNNIQLFITTHSDYAYNYLYYHYKSAKELAHNFRCFHVTNNKQTGDFEARVEANKVNIIEDLHGRPA